MKKALIIIDFINDIISPEWKLAGKWYAKFALENNIISNTNEKIKEFKKNWDLIIFVKITFKQDYSNQPKNSPLFWKANEFEIFKENSEWNNFYKELNILESDIIINKTRVSAFYKTELENILKENNISDLYFCWVATDLAIESAVREWHDRDYNCFILEKCCVAWDIETHKNSLKNLEKISKII